MSWHDVYNMLEDKVYLYEMMIFLPLLIMVFHLYGHHEACHHPYVKVLSNRLPLHSEELLSEF